MIINLINWLLNGQCSKDYTFSTNATKSYFNEINELYYIVQP